MREDINSKDHHCFESVGERRQIERFIFALEGKGFVRIVQLYYVKDNMVC